MSESDYIYLDKIVATETSLAEYSEGNPVVEIEKEKIIRIELKKSLAAERPIVQAVVGIISTLAGIYFTDILVSRMICSAFFYFDISIALTLFLPCGILFTLLAFRRRLLLSVHMENDRRKLVFHRKTSREEVIVFSETIASKYNYIIENHL